MLSTVVTEKIDLDAYGLYVGAAGNWTLCNSLSLFGRASIGILLGDFDRSNFENDQINNEVIVNVKDDANCHVNHTELAVGLDYALCGFCGTDIHLTLGYEFQSFLTMLDFINFTTGDEIEAHTARNKDSLGFDGLTLGVTVGF